MKSSAKNSRVLIAAQCNDHSARLAGVPARRFFTDAETFAHTQLLTTTYYGLDAPNNLWDVYNIEAAALGAELIVPGENECPDLCGFLFNLEKFPVHLSLPAIPGSGRFDLLLEAGKKVQEAIGGETAVRVAASGPVSMAAKLAGLEDLVISLVMDDGKAEQLLEFCTIIAETWCACLRKNGLIESK